MEEYIKIAYNWSALFGFITLIVVTFVTIKIKATYALLNKLIERNHDNKMNIYLKSASAMVNMKTTVVSYGNLDIDVKELAVAHRGACMQLAKIELVGSVETITMIIKYTSNVELAIVELMADRFEIEQSKHTIENIKLSIDNGFKMANKLFKELAILTSDDVARKDQINIELDELKTKHKEYSNQEALLDKILYREEIALIIKGLHFNGFLANLIPFAVLSMREELNIPIDGAKYLTIYPDSQILIK